MDLKDLRYFIAVYDAKGFSKASQLLGTVQSNVSTRILGLERTLGVQLFERQWRSLVPTASADKLYADAKVVLAAVNQTERSFKVRRPV
jgi:DNA-binding transcriptional LysR family regulator